MKIENWNSYADVNVNAINQWTIHHKYDEIKLTISLEECKNLFFLRINSIQSS